MRLKIILLIIVILVALVTSLYSILQIDKTRDVFKKVEQTAILAENIKYYDEVLTMSARMASFHNSLKWAQRYYKNVEPLENAINRSIELTPQIKDELLKVDYANQKLIEIEEKSISYAKEKQYSKAQELLFSIEYLNYKEQYKKGLDNTISLILTINNRLDKEAKKHLVLMQLYIFFSIFIMVIAAIYIYQILMKAMEIKQYKTLLDLSTDGIYILNDKGDLIQCSEAFAKTLGYTIEEVMKLNIKDWIVDSDDEINLSLKSLIEDSTPKIFETKHKTKSGKVIDVQLNVKGIEISKIRYLYGSQRDITEIKKKDKTLMEQTKLASLGEMIGNIAHQWRQPLSIISSGATGILMQKKFGKLNDETFEKTCNSINENAQYLSKTIDDFKNFIKGERVLVRFNLKKNIESFVNLVEPSFKKHNIELIFQEDSTIELEGYPNELKQCFINIFNNARDILKESPIEKRLIFIETKKTDDRIEIKFRDNGGGLPEDILPKVFEPYFTTKHQSQGTGLGLHMTYNLITSGMDGSLEASNVSFEYDGKSYKGAEFIISLPNRDIIK